MKAAVKHWQSQWLEEIAALCLAESRAATEEYPKNIPDVQVHNCRLKLLF